MSSVPGGSKRLVEEIDYIDPLFAVILHSALEHSFVAWYEENTFPGFRVLAITSLGFVNLFLSWQGYHVSINRRPIKSLGRFVISIVLLPLYLFTIIAAKQLWLVLLVYVAIFLGWRIWDRRKYLEYKEPKNHREHITRRYSQLIVAVTLCYLPWHTVAPSLLSDAPHGFWIVALVDWMVILLVSVAIVFLRIHKWYLARKECPEDGLARALETAWQELKGFF